MSEPTTNEPATKAWVDEQFGCLTTIIIAIWAVVGWGLALGHRDCRRALDAAHSLADTTRALAARCVR